jgi:hypothetical protein
VSAPRAPDFLDALRALRDGLAALGRPWMVIGGVAVIASGVPRYTADIDATLSAPGEALEGIVAALGQRGIVPRIADAAGFARAHHVLLLRHDASGVPLDVTLTALPFEEEALRESRECDYAGVLLRLPRVEDLVVYKLVASRPQDVEDAARLLALHGDTLDVARVTRIVEEFAAALDDQERPATLARLLRQAGLAR